jgi:hypothetical protein
MNIIPNSGNTTIIVYVLFKIMRIAFSYASFMISKNFTAQIYMEKVLVNGENPPKLVNLITLGIIVEFIMVAVSMALLYAVVTQFKINVVSDNFNIFVSYILPDYIIGTLMTFIIGYVIANKMHDKKYFLYKDDGLRAIRALSELMFTLSFINTLIPYNFIVDGIKSSIVKSSK